jgi:hypothetical protein
MKQYQSLFEKQEVVCQSLGFILGQQKSLDQATYNNIQELIDFIQRVITLEYSPQQPSITRSQVVRHRELANKLRKSGVLTAKDIPDAFFESLEDFVFHYQIVNRGLNNALQLKNKFFPNRERLIQAEITPTQQDLVYFKELNSIIVYYGLNLDKRGVEPPKCCLTDKQFSLLKQHLGSI